MARSKDDGNKANLDMLLTLHKRGFNIGEASRKKLIAAGLIEQSKPLPRAKKENEPENDPAPPTEESLETDEDVIVIPKSEVGKEQIIEEKEFEKVKESASFVGEYREITKEMWMPKSRVNHTEDFVRWIESINSENGFFSTTQYKLFNLYRQQAQQWMSEAVPEGLSDNELLDWQTEEIYRCGENTLYACNRYGKIRDSNEYGTKNYIGRKAHEILLYLFDCGYSAHIAKARQIAFTTTLCMAAMIKAGFNLDLVIKYISETDKKAQMTFDSKVKYPFTMLPVWMRPDARNDNIRELYFGKKTKKGVTEGNNSSLEVLPPTSTAIASSTPDITLIDEEGNIDILNKILSDLEPTMYGMNTATGKQELMRQMIGWGTGGEMTKFGAAFESVYMSTLNSWKERNFESGIIPLYFNVWWRPGFTKEMYDKLKKKAYDVQGPKAEETRIRFHQFYPITLEDVFLRGGKLLKPLEFINKNLERISDCKYPPDYGYFEPVYDETQPAHEGSDVPFKIRGVNFIPCSPGDERITTAIFMHPKKWLNRYYQGTDPIASDNGYSNMASAIWDAHFATVSACMNFRTENYRYVFLQTMLLGMYYNVDKDKQATMELLEANIGTAYREYKENKGLGRAMVLGTELPPVFQTKSGTTNVGIDNKGLRNTAIINLMHQVFDSFGENLYLPVFFNQLKTFTCKQVGRAEVWEPIDKKNYRDDTLFALTYAYLCSQCFSHLTPESIEGELSEAHQKPVKYELYRDANGHLGRRIKRPEPLPVIA